MLVVIPYVLRGSGHHRGPTFIHTLRAWLLAVCLLAGLLAGGSAQAHASLHESEPADNAVLDQLPSAVRLVFNEPVTTRTVALLAPDGHKHVLSHIATIDNGLEIPLPPSGSSGTYALTWRVTSADGHPVGGTLVFSVGAASVIAPGVAAATPYLAQAIWLNRVILSVSLLFGVGGALFGAWFSPAAAALRTGLCATLCIALLALPVALGFQGLDVTGDSWRALGAWATWWAAMDTSYGCSVGLMAAAALAALLALWRTQGPPGAKSTALARALGLLGAVLLALAFTRSGHASTAPPTWLARSAVSVHVLALLIWVGALVPLLALLRQSPEHSAAALARFRRSVAWAVFGLLASGVVLALLQVDRPQALWLTQYGMVLLAKIAFVLVLLGFGACNRYCLTGRIARGDHEARHAMRRTIRIEIALVLCVLALVALWRFTVPPRALDAPPPETPLTLQLGNTQESASLTLFLARDGRGHVDISLVKTDGQPLIVEAVALAFSNATLGIEPIVRKAALRQDGNWYIDPIVLPAAGDWTVNVDMQVSDTERRRLHGTLYISGPASSNRMR